jgi:4-amino-4-deoxy-L-arabinose transferase-like glycosyltransferase
MIKNATDPRPAGADAPRAEPAGAPPVSPARRWWLLYAVAAATFLPAIGFHYVGEEAIFPISSLEMWHRREWLQQLFYGASLLHNPLFNWLIIPVAAVVGWEHMLAVTRALTILATAGTGLVVAWLAHALYRDAAFSAFAALVYLTLADVFFYRGWLAYADPLFALFLAAAMASLWIACLRRSHGLLALAVGMLTCAFMTKAMTAYAFYGGTALALVLADRRHLSFLLSPASWLAHLAGAAFLVGWLGFVPDNTGQGARMFAEILAKLAPTSWLDYGLKLATYPLDTAVRLAPALLVAGYFAWRRGEALPRDPHRRVALGILLINYLPYWLAPQSSMRYLLPLFPLAGLAIARVLWDAGPHALAVTRRWLVAAIVLKLLLVLVAFPLYQEHYRGRNFEQVARDIRARVGTHPLYTNNVTASGMSVVAHLDILRLPAPPLTFPPQRWDSGFVITYTPEPELGRVAMEYRLGGNRLYLLCRGAACAAVTGGP